MTTELALCLIFEEDVFLMLRSGYSFEGSSFCASATGVAGQMNAGEGSQNAASSNLLGRAKRRR